jgi:tyrosinase
MGKKQQQIWNYAQTIAATYPDSNRATYVYEAYYLRVPYWDWAADPALPNCLVTPQITITTPSGPQTIDNPLYTYKFHPLPLGTDIPTNDPVRFLTLDMKPLFEC